MSRSVLCFGELLLRLGAPGDTRLLQTAVLEWYAGGSEANVAAQLAQLGVGTRYVTRIPSHAVADGVLAALRAHGVDCRDTLRGGTRLGSYFVERGAAPRPLTVIYDREGSAFSELTGDTVDWSTLLAGTAWLHSSGITAGVGRGPADCLATAIRAARTHGTRVSLDLNWRPAVWGARDPQQVMPSLVHGIDLLIGNPAACAAMLDIAAPGADAHARIALARALRDRFALGRVAITHRVVESPRRHHFEALVLDGATDTVVESPVWSVDVVDRVGGGDAFAGALLADLVRDVPLAQAVPFAVAASALKLSVAGDMNRTTRTEIETAVRVRAEQG
ncbi:MAG: sugar kinase [Gemmatimonadaceae bacterium]|jgi:2-dehydro-3-deoxygluconokinase|nr:sugar kinase [Gemmatimonadaceae bacterium]